MNPSRPLTRRTLLRRGMAAGTAAALGPFVPLLERDAEAQAKDGGIKRLVLIYWSGGAGTANYVPNGNETQFTFPEVSKALNPHTKKLIVFGNMRRAQDNAHGSHQAGTSGIWTGARLYGPGAKWVSHPSIDKMIVNAIKQPTPLQTLDLDVQSQDPGNLRGNTMYGLDLQPIHGEQDPTRAFDRIFTDGVVTKPTTPGDTSAADRLRARRKSVLDLVRTEINDLSGSFGGQDRKKLQQHLDAVRATELRLTMPVGGGGIAGYKPPTRDAFPTLDYKYPSQAFPMVAKLHMDLLVHALATDQTRIINLQMSQGNGDVTYKWVGVNTQHHALSHKGEYAAGMDNIRRWYYEMFGSLLARMDGIAEGPGTLLDNSLVVWGQEFIDGAAHDTDPWPVILAGSGAGRFKTGRYINFAPQAHSNPRLFPGDAAANASPNAVQLLTSLCHFMGLNVPRVGDPTMGPAGPLEALG
jgi:hypothetical protein